MQQQVLFEYPIVTTDEETFPFLVFTTKLELEIDNLEEGILKVYFEEPTQDDLEDIIGDELFLDQLRCILKIEGFEADGIHYAPLQEIEKGYLRFHVFDNFIESWNTKLVDVEE